MRSVSEEAQTLGYSLNLDQSSLLCPPRNSTQLRKTIFLSSLPIRRLWKTVKIMIQCIGGAFTASWMSARKVQGQILNLDSVRAQQSLRSGRKSGYLISKSWLQGLRVLSFSCKTHSDRCEKLWLTALSSRQNRLRSSERLLRQLSWAMVYSSG